MKPITDYERLKITLEKDNDRVTFEWDKFLGENPCKNWNDLTQEAQQKATALAELQGNRSVSIFKKIGLHFDGTQYVYKG